MKFADVLVCYVIVNMAFSKTLGRTCVCIQLWTDAFFNEVEIQEYEWHMDI
jgi:hypothetical protein